MSASEIGLEELLPQKRSPKNNFYWIKSEETYCIGTTNKNYRKN